MKSLLLALLATAAGTLAAAPAWAKYPGFYLVTFTAPTGPFQHCFQLVQTQQYLSDGYTYSGTWVDTDFPATSGTWVVFKDVIHLAGSVDGSAYLAIDGRIHQGHLIKGTFDYFDGSGTYFAAGSMSEMSDSSCAGQSRHVN